MVEDTQECGQVVQVHTRFRIIWQKRRPSTFFSFVRGGDGEVGFEYVVEAPDTWRVASKVGG